MKNIDAYSGFEQGPIRPPFDPSNGKMLGELPRASSTQIEEAIARANNTTYGLGAVVFGAGVRGKLRIAWKRA